MINQTAKKSKELTIVAIYKFKSNGKLNGTRCTLVRNEEGKEHKVWTHANGCAASCDCDGFEKSHGRRKCYHLKAVEAMEAARKSAIIEQTAQTLNISSEEVAKIAAIAAQMQQEKADAAAQRQAELDAAKVRLNYETSAEAASKRRMSAPLNGNQGFSLLKKAS